MLLTDLNSNLLFNLMKCEFIMTDIWTIVGLTYKNSTLLSGKSHGMRKKSLPYLCVWITVSLMFGNSNSD